MAKHEDKTPPVEPREFYLLDARNGVGNCALWWGPDCSGYTTEIGSAGLYTRTGAFEQNANRKTDIPVHRDVVDRIAVKHVRIEALRQELDGRLIMGESGHLEEEEPKVCRGCKWWGADPDGAYCAHPKTLEAMPHGSALHCIDPARDHCGPELKSWEANS